MRFSLTTLGFLAAVLGAAGCSVSADGADAKATPVVPPAPAAALIHFEQEGTITLEPGKSRSISVVASPPTTYDVRFALIGDALDGWIESAAVKADASGVATIELHAPNQPTTFHLRASIVLENGEAGPSAETSVAVSAQGFGTVRVLPQYTGKRPVQTWTASVAARTTCADLAATLPGEPDGALVAKAAFGAAPLVLNAPVGPNLAVAVRAGHYGWGCADTTDLKADGTLDVKVTIVDKPIDLASTDLDLALKYEPDAVGYGALLASAGALLRQAFLPKGAPEAELVLTAMGQATPVDQAAGFEAARATLGWNALASAHFEGLETSVGDRCSSWISAGLPLQAHLIKAHLAAKIGAPGVAAVNVLTIGSVDADSAGVPAASPFSWTANPDDTLILGGIIAWQPARYVGAAALAGAKVAQPNAQTMADALAQAADCAGLAAKLQGFGACDTACVATLCAQALGDRWTLGLAASTDAGLLGHLTITASGPAQIDDTAKLRGFTGIWLGTVSDTLVSAKVKGSFEGTQPANAPPP
jgi:hypothetical protein